MHSLFKEEKENLNASEIYSYLPRQRCQNVGHYNCLINSNNQVKHKLSTQGSLLFQR
jgi:ArsR family metal-binding transcriptional regulator